MDDICLCTLLSSLILFVCMASLTLAMITLRGLTIQPYAHICLINGSYLSFFGVDGLVDVFVMCVGIFHHSYGKVRCGIKGPV